jgi:hypothetical protein
MRENQSFDELPKPKELKLCAARRFAARKSKWGTPRLGSQAPTLTAAMAVSTPVTIRQQTTKSRRARGHFVSKMRGSRRSLKSAETTVRIELVFDLAGRVSSAAVPAFELWVLSANRRM